MEVSKEVTVTCGSGSFKLTRQLTEKNMAAYFTMYEISRPQTICLVSNLQVSDNKIISDVLPKIKSCKELIGADTTLNYKKVDEITQIQGKDNRQIVLVYNGIKWGNSLNCMRGKLSETETLQLAIFLLNIVIKMKQQNAYFGSLHPSRIFQSAQLEYCFMGGEFFTKKCSVSDFMTANNELKSNLANNYKYQSPQMYDQSATLDYSSDLFIVGCILYEIMSGEYPFPTVQSLVSREMTNKSNNSIVQQIWKKVLQPNQNTRMQPEQLMKLVQLERGRTMFNTCKLEMPMGQSTVNKSGFFDNFQQFIMKCTTETEGWFLYFCQNSQQRPDQKYLDQSITKISKKSEKINKIIGLIEKCSSKQIKQVNTNYDQDNTYSIMKMGLFMLHMLRRLPVDIVEPYYNCLSKVCSKIVVKNAQNKIIVILFKIIAFKISLSSKFEYFGGNFHLTPQDYMRTTTESMQYVCQYCLKIISYFNKLIEQHCFDNIVQCETATLVLLSDQLYNATSTVLYCLISMKKDCALKIADRQNISTLTFKKLDSLCLQMIIQINKLCNSQSLFGCHQLYSVSGDIYQYQQQLCLMYCPILTSYQYFYLDKNQYKGLTLPKNYSNPNDDYEHQQEKYLNRKPMLNRLVSIKTSNDQQAKMNSGQNVKKQNNNSEITASMKSEGFSSQKSPDKPKPVVVVQVQPKTQKKITPAQQKQIDDFKAFFTNINNSASKDQSSASNAATLATNTASSVIEKSNESNKSLSWMDPNEHDILSYEYLKKTEKMATQIFQKPEIDATIYKVFDDICKGLKLHQLIETISKNKKVIIDPNQVLFQKVIGSGSAGDVYIGKYKQNVVAIKKVKLASNPNALKEFEREVLTYIKIKSHPNLVSLVGLTKFSQDYFLLTQFCQGGSLFDLLHKRSAQIVLSWPQRLSIALDIAKGMEVLHFMNPPVIHRDLKSLNVFMIYRNNRWIGKVADFGLSRTPDADMMTSALGTLHWMAPELLSNKQYSLKVDVYSFAVVLWQICSRRTPYHNIPNQMGIVKHVVLEKGRPLLDLIPHDCPKQLINLIKKCWSQEPEERPYFSEIVIELTNFKL